MMRRAAKLWIASICLGSLCGCGRTVYVPAPVPLPDCPAPERPALPPYAPDAPFDGPDNLSITLRRDMLLKRYAEGLESALRCYGGPHDRHID